MKVNELVGLNLEALLDLFNERGWPDALIQDINFLASELTVGGQSITFTVFADVVYECTQCAYELASRPPAGRCAQCDATPRLAATAP